MLLALALVAAVVPGVPVVMVLAPALLPAPLHSIERALGRSLMRTKGGQRRQQGQQPAASAGRGEGPYERIEFPGLHTRPPARLRAIRGSRGILVASSLLS
jgi:hypothetical protein